LNFVSNIPSSQNLNRVFTEKVAGKFLNLDFNGWSSRKIKNRGIGGQVASKIFFLKRATEGENIITGRSRMGNWLHSFQLFDHRQRDYLNFLKKTGRRKLQELYCTNISKPGTPENQTLAKPHQIDKHPPLDISRCLVYKTEPKYWQDCFLHLDFLSHINKFLNVQKTIGSCYIRTV
jgi:hypothetical protein